MITLLSILVAISCLGIMGILAGGIVVYARINKASNQFVETLYSCFEASPETGLSPLATFIDHASDLASQKIGISVQQGLKGAIGGSMKGVNAQLEEVAAGEDTTAALAMSLPKSLKKNPLALMGLNILVQKMIQGQGQASTPGNGKVNQAKFSL